MFYRKGPTACVMWFPSSKGKTASLQYNYRDFNQMKSLDQRKAFDNMSMEYHYLSLSLPLYIYLSIYLSISPHLLEHEKTFDDGSVSLHISVTFFLISLSFFLFLFTLFSLIILINITLLRLFFSLFIFSLFLSDSLLSLSLSISI